jgi:hypothetical protein
VDTEDMSKRLDDFVIEMITRHYLMEEGKWKELKREEDQIKRLKISIQKQPKTFL